MRPPSPPAQRPSSRRPASRAQAETAAHHRPALTPRSPPPLPPWDGPRGRWSCTESRLPTHPPSGPTPTSGGARGSTARTNYAACKQPRSTRRPRPVRRRAPRVGAHPRPPRDARPPPQHRRAPCAGDTLCPTPRAPHAAPAAASRPVPGDSQQPDARAKVPASDHARFACRRRGGGSPHAQPRAAQPETHRSELQCARGVAPLGLVVVRRRATRTLGRGTRALGWTPPVPDGSNQPVPKKKPRDEWATATGQPRWTSDTWG